jgi:hypothetical protein
MLAAAIQVFVMATKRSQQSHGDSHSMDPHVTAYLDSFLKSRKNERVKCCGSSRSLFCCECCRLLIRKEEWPSCLQANSLQLPFDLHIVLDDQRATATGLHAVALLGNQVSLVDVKRGDRIPDYSTTTAQTYLLFPSLDSVPISSVNDISTMVVLDCKWTKTSLSSSSLSHLPRVTLLSPPLESHFWRSHTAGEKCLSTIEAIYYAVMERDHNDDFIHLLWLFALQRAAIQARGLWKDRKGLPFTQVGKEEQRAYRRQKHKDKVEDDDNKLFLDSHISC